MKDLGALILDDYVHNGPRTLRHALAHHPDTIYLIPILASRIDKEFPMASMIFREEFAAQLAHAPVVAQDANEVGHPAHYTQGGIECIDAMEASMSAEEFRGYLKGCMFKYLWRYRVKGHPVQDLQKLGWYRDRLEATCARTTKSSD